MYAVIVRQRHLVAVKFDNASELVTNPTNPNPNKSSNRTSHAHKCVKTMSESPNSVANRRKAALLDVAAYGLRIVSGLGIIGIQRFSQVSSETPTLLTPAKWGFFIFGTNAAARICNESLYAGHSY